MSAPSVEVEVDHVVLMPGDDLRVSFLDLGRERPRLPIAPTYEVQLVMGTDGRPRLFVSDGIEVLDWSERRLRVCGCGTVVQDGPDPKTHLVCPLCEEAYELELQNEDGPAGGDGDQTVDSTTPGQGGDALRREGNGSGATA